MRSRLGKCKMLIIKVFELFCCFLPKIKIFVDGMIQAKGLSNGTKIEVEHLLQIQGQLLTTRLVSNHASSLACKSRETLARLFREQQYFNSCL